MKRRDVVRKLRRAGCTPKKPDTGRHSTWTCPCAKEHKFPLPRHNDISPGVLDDAIAKLPCLPKGWLR